MTQLRVYCAGMMPAKTQVLLMKAIKLLGAMLLLSALPSLSAAKDIPGATQTSYGVSSSGAFQFSMPIVVPQGRNGVQPNLALNFSSNQGAGALGVGWSVSGLSAITRCGKSVAVDNVRGGVQHNSNDRYCLNGQRLILVAGTQGAANSEYRTRVDSFAKIVAYGTGSQNVNGGRAPTRWRVWTKSGQIIDYGAPIGVNSHSAQFKLPGTDSIHVWNMARMGDREGNFVAANYRNEDGLIESLEYTFDGNTAKHKVEFIYETNSEDPRFRYILGSRVDFNDRLSRVEVLNDNQRFRRYELNYETAPMSGRSRVVGITECGQGNSCMPEVSFDWQASQPGYSIVPPSSVINIPNIAPDDTIEYLTYRRQLGNNASESAVKEIRRGNWVDVNNDGEADLVIAYTAPNGNDVIRTYLRQGNQWVTHNAGSAWALPRPLRSYEDAIVNTLQARFLPDSINMGQFSDVNGDGLVDLVYSYRLDPHRTQTSAPADYEVVRETYINTGNGWSRQAAWAPKDLLFDYIVNGAGTTRTATSFGSLVDLNGDGLVDWVTAYFDHTSNGNGNEIKRTWINNGNGWVRDTAYDMPDVFSQYRGIYSIPRGQFVDVNGDGLMDWMSSYHTASDRNPVRRLWLNSGTGWQEQPAGSPYILPETIFDNINGWNNISPVTQGRFIDVNGDGLADWVSSFERVGGGQERYVRLNTGRGWGARNAGFAAPEFVHINFRYSTFERGWPSNNGGVYMDVNQDGLVDYVESFKSSATGFPVTRKAWLNTGEGWEMQPANSPYTPLELYFDYSGRENAQANFGDFIDINSDGAADWVRSRQGSTRGTLLMRTARADQLASATTTMGVTVTPDFLPLTHNSTLYTQVPVTFEGDAVAAEPNGRFVRGPLYVTASVTVPTPEPGTERVSSYQYEGLQINRIDGSQGFHNITTVDSVTGIASYREVEQAFPFTGRTKRAATLKDGRLISLSSSNYGHSVRRRLENTVTYFPQLLNSRSEQYEYSASNAEQSLVRATNVAGIVFDEYGNLEQQITQVFDGRGALMHTTDLVNTFHPANEAQWLVSQVSQVEQTNTTTNQSPVTNVTSFTYSNESRGGVNLGRLDTIVREPESSQAGVALTTKYGYDRYGNVTSESTFASADAQTEVRHRIDRIGYDSDSRLPISLTNALGQTDTIEYHGVCDAPVKVTDANQLISRATYDNFCRPLTQTSAVGLVSSIRYNAEPQASFCGPQECQSTPAFVITATAPGEPDVVQTFNKFNQVMRTTTLGVTDQTIVQLNYYDARGQLASASQPFFAGDTRFWTNFSYDALGRVVNTELPYDNDEGGRAAVNVEFDVDSTTRFLERITTDIQGRVTKAQVNALGQVKRVIDVNNQALNYFYDSQGNLNRTRDVLGNEITLGYDRLGRRTRLTDPDLGESTYTFNVWGDLLSRTDAKGQVFTMEYDKLSRLTRRVVPGTAEQSGGESTWAYDQAPRSGSASGLIGAISRVTGPNGYEQRFAYDRFGRPDSQHTTIRGITFNERFAYEADTGFLSERYYPDSKTGDANNQINAEFGVQYSYTNGFLTSILSIEDQPEQCVEHWRADNYDALGRVNRETLGKLVSTQRTFKPGQNVLQRIQSITTVGEQTAVQDLRYQYDAVNNLTQREDALGVTGLETFEYDNLDRLTAHHKGDETVTVRYDEIGNITFKSDVGSYNYAPNSSNQNSHRLMSVTGGPQVPGAPASTPDLSQFAVDWEFDGQDFIRSLPNTNNLTFDYDDNGSVTANGASRDASGRVTNATRSIDWTSFDKPSRMLKVNANGESTGSLYQYGPEQQRIYKKEAKFATLSNITEHGEETIYLGKYYERITNGAGAVTHRYTIETGGHSIQIERADGTRQDQPKYLLADNLGSTNVILNGFGEVEQRLAFDPWGLRLNVGDQSSVNSVTNRGYTGHEMDDETGLINMNARVYDPYLGRFLSADPVLPDAGNMQQYNRYAYVTNNPLKYIDPTGNSGVDTIVVTAPKPSGGDSTGVARPGDFLGGAGGPSAPPEGLPYEPPLVDEEVQEPEEALEELTVIGMRLETIARNINGLRRAIRNANLGQQLRRGLGSLIEEAEEEFAALSEVFFAEFSELLSTIQASAQASGTSFGQRPPGGGSGLGDISRLCNFEVSCQQQQFQNVLEGQLTALSLVICFECGFARAVASVKAIRSLLVATKGPRVFKNLAPGEEIGQAITFSISSIKAGFSGRRNFVVLESGELIIGKTGHLSLSRGANVLSAGEAKFVGGALRSLNNQSGHFKPFGANAKNAAESAFEKAGFDAVGKFIEKAF